MSLKYDEKQKGAAKYDPQRGDRAPLTEEEQTYLIFDLDNIVKPESRKEAERESKRFMADFMAGRKGSKKSNIEDDDDVPDLEDDDEDTLVSKKKKKVRANSDDDDDVPFDAGKK